jgi:hypothetical protein
VGERLTTRQRHPCDAALVKPWDEQPGDVGGAHGVAIVAGRDKAVGAGQVATLGDCTKALRWPVGTEVRK